MHGKASPMYSEILNLLTVVHFFSMAGLAVYGLHRLWMIGCGLRISPVSTVVSSPPQSAIPRVTVQIPLYNEPRVARRIIDAVAALDWPNEKLQIQVLDDSDDDTQNITRQQTAYWKLKGKQISLLHRRHRPGYKAGALSAGLKQASGEFIAVFDADFVPTPDFLKQTVPYFKRSDVGMVQARWAFLNAKYSWLTRLQALLLSAHFGIEHRVRCHRGLFFNFNGTAGIWRKSAIEAAGGWQSDTVTEDLDLSYRAQLIGWRFVYVHDVLVPSELPVTLMDFRSQQERWSKGAIQTARKLLPRLLSAYLPLSVKVEAIAHLLSNCCWVFGFLATITLYPVLLNRIDIGVHQVLWIDIPLFLFTGGAVLVYYLLYAVKSGSGSSLLVLPLLPAASIGLAPFFSFAVLKGAIQKGGVFTRTPKFGIVENTTRQSFYFPGPEKAFFHFLINSILFTYMIAPVLFSLNRGTWAAVPFLCLFPAGFFLMIVCDFQEYVSGRIKRV
jgi:cellulose synthase/poly-beta-1,6-N-acetylglucosamine synthase-like glycosyltransferase